MPIFISQKEVASRTNVISGTLSVTDVLKLIPKDHLDAPDTDKLKTHTEWRWRFFEFIDGMRMV